MKHYLVYAFIAVICFSSASCDKKDDNTNGTAKFQIELGTAQNGLKNAGENDLSSVKININNSNGEVVKENLIINLTSFGAGYISDPIPLEPGDYYLSEFLVLNAENEIVFAAPKSGSAMAYLVSDPLDISFSIGKDEVTKVSPEVLSTETKLPGDFGYATFGINEVETIDFLVAVFTYNEDIANYELTESEIVVTSLSDTLFSGSTDAKTTSIRIAHAYSTYNVKVSKPGYRSYVASYSADSLMTFFDSPLTIILEEALLSDGLIAYYPFDGDCMDYSGNNNYCIDSSRGEYVDGMIGSGLNFDGVSDYLQLSETLDGSEGLSFSFWVNSNGLAAGENNGTVICKYNMYSDYTCFSVNTAGYLTSNNSLRGNFYASRYSTDYRDCAWSDWKTKDDILDRWDASLFSIHNPMDLPVFEWAHCVVNVTETSIQAWINGVLTVEKIREYDTYLDDPNEPTFIGNNVYGGEGFNNHLNGILDELRVYDRALSEDEINTLYELR